MSSINEALQLNLYLKARDGQPAGLVRQRGDGNDEGAVRDVLVVELDGHLVVTWEAEGVFTGVMVSHRYERGRGKGPSTWFFDDVGDTTGAILPVLK